MNRVKVRMHGFPEIAEIMGGTTLEFAIKGDTFGDLMEHIEREYGKEVTTALLIQVMKNGTKWIDRKDMSAPLKDGDTFAFFCMIAGG